ncbi:hypothetical protein QTP86_007551 [Hemibagrus guttatus]|nr:hypothetical protein QTP86_007551 [Hemibagrus guttatus]
MAAVSGNRVLIYGGRGALGSTCVHHFKSKGWWVASIDIGTNEEADANVLAKICDSFCEHATQVSSDVARLLGDQKVDAIVCVAGGWAGGNCASKDVFKNSDLMWKQSVWTSTISTYLASHHLKPGGLLTLTGAKASLSGTPAGKMDKCKDLSEFDKGHIVMARPLDQSISKTAALVGCSRSAVGYLGYADEQEVHARRRLQQLDTNGIHSRNVLQLGRRVRAASLRQFDPAGDVSTLNFIPDRSRPGLTTTAICAVDLQGVGGNWATVGRRSRGGRRVCRQREKRKGKSVGLRIGTLNVGTMTGKGRELADMMERRKVDILCVQETRWKGSKARSIGAGFKLFYYGVDSKRNGVGVVLKEEFVRNVLEVKRVSDRVMSLKLEIEGVMLNVVSGYAPQVGCELE